MNKRLALDACLVSFLMITTPAFADARNDLLKAYVNSLSAEQKLWELASPDSWLKSPAPFDACIAAVQLMKLQLESDEAELQAIAMPGDFIKTPSMLAQWLSLTADLYEIMGDVCTSAKKEPDPIKADSLLKTVVPDIEEKLAAQDSVTEINAFLVFAPFIANVKAPEGHTGRLSITKAERDDLVRYIDAAFPQSDTQPVHGPVGAAISLRNYLTKKGYICSDE